MALQSLIHTWIVFCYASPFLLSKAEDCTRRQRAFAALMPPKGYY